MANTKAFNLSHLAASSSFYADAAEDSVLKVINLNMINLNAVDEYHRGHIHHATHHGFKEVIRLLSKGGNRVNALDCDGKTALHYACEAEAVDDLMIRCLIGKVFMHMLVVCLLISDDWCAESGADCLIQDSKGTTPFDILISKTGSCISSLLAVIKSLSLLHPLPSSLHENQRNELLSFIQGHENLVSAVFMSLYKRMGVVAQLSASPAIITTLEIRLFCVGT